MKNSLDVTPRPATGSSCLPWRRKELRTVPSPEPTLPPSEPTLPPSPFPVEAIRTSLLSAQDALQREQAQREESFRKYLLQEQTKWEKMVEWRDQHMPELTEEAFPPPALREEFDAYCRSVGDRKYPFYHLYLTSKRLLAKHYIIRRNPDFMEQLYHLVGTTDEFMEKVDQMLDDWSKYLERVLPDPTTPAPTPTFTHFQDPTSPLDGFREAQHLWTAEEEVEILRHVRTLFATHRQYGDLSGGRDDLHELDLGVAFNAYRSEDSMLLTSPYSRVYPFTPEVTAIWERLKKGLKLDREEFPDHCHIIMYRGDLSRAKPHVDHRGFCDDLIVGCSFGQSATFQLLHPTKTYMGTAFPRSGYAMQGRSRYDSKHAVTMPAPPEGSPGPMRISFTFRWMPKDTMFPPKWRQTLEESHYWADRIPTYLSFMRLTPGDEEEEEDPELPKMPELKEALEARWARVESIHREKMKKEFEDPLAQLEASLKALA